MVLRRPRRRAQGRSPLTGSVQGPVRGGLSTGPPKPRPKARINRPRRLVAPQAVAPTAPPPAPNFLAPPPSSIGQSIRANAEQSWGNAQNTYRDAVFRAAMALGDQSIFDKLKADPQFAGYSFAQDPTSTFAQLARQEQEGLKDIDYGANDTNTYFSGFRLKDRGDYSRGITDQRQGAVKSYKDALAEYAAALSAALGEYGQAGTDALQADIDALASLEPTAQSEAVTTPTILSTSKQPTTRKKPKKKPGKKGKKRK